MSIKIKNKDPKKYEFRSNEIVINEKEGTLFYKSNNDLFKISGDNVSTTKNEQLSEDQYDITKLYNFRFFCEDIYQSGNQKKFAPLFGGADTCDSTADYGSLLAAPYDGKITEISISFASQKDHSFWEQEDPEFKLRAYKTTSFVHPYSSAAPGITQSLMDPTSHQNLWEENPGPGVSVDQFQWDNPGAATWTEDFLSETIIKDKIRRLVVFKFGDSLSFLKGDGIIFALEVDDVASTNNNDSGNFIGHTTVKYDTSSVRSWTT